MKKKNVRIVSSTPYGRVITIQLVLEFDQATGLKDCRKTAGPNVGFMGVPSVIYLLVY